MKKRFLSMLLATAMVVTTLVTPLVASAAVNNNRAVDTIGSGSLGVKTVYTLPAQKTELTLNQGGKYQLKLSNVGLSKKAQMFTIVNDYTISYDTIENDEVVTKYLGVEWQSTNESIVKASAKGWLKGIKVSKLNSKGNYISTAVNAVVEEGEYRVLDNGVLKTVKFEGGIIATNKTFIVPTDNLTNYFLGVWKEDLADKNAQHNTNYAINSENVAYQILKLAEDATKHCKGEAFEIFALTKSKNAKVRAYVKTTNKDAGTHYYVVTYLNDGEGFDKISVVERDWCATKYSKTNVEYVR